MKNKIKVLMRLVVASLMCSMLVLSTLQVSAYIQKPGEISQDVSLKEDASTTSSTLQDLTKGTQVVINNEIEDGNEELWYQVYVDDIFGYVQAFAVNVEASSETNQEGTDSSGTSSDVVTTTETIMQKIGTAPDDTAINMRADASTSADLVASVPALAKVDIIGEKQGTDNMLWYQVEYTENGSVSSGYIRNDLLTTSEEERTITVEKPAEPEPTPEVPQEPTEEASPYTVKSEEKEGVTVWYVVDEVNSQQVNLENLFAGEIGGGSSPATTILFVIVILLLILSNALFILKWRDAENFIRKMHEKQKRVKRQQQIAAKREVKKEVPAKAKTGEPVKRTKENEQMGDRVKVNPPSSIKPNIAKPKMPSMPLEQPVAKAEPTQRPQSKPEINLEVEIEGKEEQLQFNFKEEVPMQTQVLDVEEIERKIEKVIERQPQVKATTPVSKEAISNTEKVMDILVNAKKEEKAEKETESDKKWKSKNFLTDTGDLELEFLDFDE